MIKLGICILLSVAFYTATAQRLVKQYNEVVANRIIVTNENETITAFTHPVTSTQEPDLNKNYYWFAAHQIRVTQGGYSGKLLNGPYNSYYPNKNLKEQGQFTKGLKTGTWKNWHSNGKLKGLVKWKKGNQTGRFYQYDEQGLLKKRGRFKRGQYDGKVATFADSDSAIFKSYRSGKEVVVKPKVNNRGKSISKYLKKLVPKRKKGAADENPKKKNTAG